MLSAINATTLKVTGTNLTELKVEDIKVANNTVKSVVVAVDGKTATVTLENKLVLDTTTKVTVKDTEFNVLYEIKGTEVAVVEGATFDDDTEDQFVKLLVNGQEFTAAELISAGYTVEFEAFTTKSAVTTAPIFVSAASKSKTGELNSAIALTNTVEDYFVRATVTNGSEVMISGVTKIQITNKDIAADGITDVVLTNLGTNGTYEAGTDFEQASSTLVTGEEAKISEITVKSGDKNEVLVAGQFTVKSSDEAVVSADKNQGYKLVAQGPGTTTLTISYGGSTFTKTITVKSDARKETSVKVDKTTVAVKEAGTASLKVQLVDQYGDPMKFTAATDLQVVSSDEKIATGILTGSSTSNKLVGALEITGVDTGSAVFTFRNGAGTKLGSTSVTATVTNNAAISQYLLSVDNDITTNDIAAINADNTLTLTKNDISTDATIDTGDDRYVKIRIKGANNTGQVIVDKPVATTDYIVSSVSSSDLNVLDTSVGGNADGVYVQDGYILVKAGSENGSATITIKDVANPSITKTFKVTVTDKGFTVSGVTFKDVPAITYAQTLDFEDFLTYTKSANDYIIKGLTLSQSVSQAVRLDGNVLYIDKDGSGKRTSADVVVGSVVLSTTGTFTSPATGGSTIDVKHGDDGTVFFKVLNTGKDKVVGNDDEVIATKSVKVNF